MSRMRMCVVALFVMAAAAAFADEPMTMRVNVKETQVRATPSYLGKILDVLSYEDPVLVLEILKGWARVSVAAKRVEGWINVSALSEKRVALKSGAGKVEQGASSGEMALAGKGFNSQVEAQYRQDSKMDYTWVDRMGQLPVSPEQVAAFLTEGGLATAPGGAQ